MAPRFRTAMGLALAGFLMVAPISMAAGTPGGSAGSTSSPGAGSTTGQSGTQMQQPGTGSMGQHAGKSFQATVEDIDQDARTVELRPEGGDTVELKVPNKEILSGLKKGDRVQVSIQQSAGMQGATGSQPGQSR
jgi:Cu/Ag efflux protein CusF